MLHLWQGLRRHPVTTSLFALLWLVTWPVTVLTWERDAAGHSIGMAPSAIPLHLALPLMLGVVVGLSGATAPGARAKRCTLAGVVFGVAEFGILALVDLLWLPAVESGPPFRELAAATVVGAVMYAGVCAVLGMLGGVLATAWTAWFHRGGRGNRPAASATSH